MVEDWWSESPASPDHFRPDPLQRVRETENSDQGHPDTSEKGFLLGQVDPQVSEGGYGHDRAKVIGACRALP